MSDEIKVLLVDDHTVVRSGLGAVQAVSDDLKLIGEAADGEEAVRFCERTQPDVILMDLLMPKMDGVAATKAIKARWPKTQIIILTSFKEKEYVEGALKAGAVSYLLKNVTADELINAVRKPIPDNPAVTEAAVLIQK
jgi:NarL family two-component system response regulator LiaR